MPELPEVETIRRQLEKEIVGKRITSVDVFFAKRLNMTVGKFRKMIVGHRIRSVRRRAKMILIDLSGGQTMAVHLKMTGKLLFVDGPTERNKHSHITFCLSGGKTLIFNDVRKFGWIRLLETDMLKEKLFRPMKLGPEPFSRGFTVETLTRCLRSHDRAALKPLIMSQRCVVGVGNIYTDEVLWRARVKPDRKAGTLTVKEIEALHKEIKSVLKDAIKRRGSSVDDYVDAYGKPGTYGLKHEVYGREGEKCARCGGRIRKIRLGGRGTHFCPKCQR
ncbi:MAG: DNA-formamidopyrimidine glycosylase [Patescibacteria group bacterium]|nr:DNA-formamidopyrimidine glycosylase [Patescibacteria group bacterium]